jgi:hypothetical protein
MKSPPAIFKHLACGFTAGAVVSAAPFELCTLLVPGLLVLWWFLAKRCPPGNGLKSHALVGGAALATICTAAFLPFKNLDGNVGPINYERMSLDGLCEALRKDYRVFARAPYPQGTNIFVAFHTDRPLPRRDVLERLAEIADCDLHIGRCGNGASLLFGGQPYFTRLEAKNAKQVDAPNERR